MQRTVTLALIRSRYMFIRKVFCLLLAVFLISSISVCAESDEDIADRSRRLDIEFESMIRAVFRRESMDSWLEGVEPRGVAYLGKTTVTYPDKSGAYLVYGLQHVSTINRGDAYIFLFCNIDIGYPGSLCASSSRTFLSAENYSVDAIKKLVRRSNAQVFHSFEYLGGFEPNQRSFSIDINYEPNFE